MDLGTLLGIAVAFGGILTGQVLEGGSILEMLQPTAALIVFGGTIGATMIGFPLSTSLNAVGDLIMVFKEDSVQPDGVIDQIIQFTNRSKETSVKGRQRQCRH